MGFFPDFYDQNIFTYLLLSVCSAFFLYMCYKPKDRPVENTVED